MGEENAIVTEIFVRVAEDKMTAHLSVHPIDEAREFTFSELMDSLKQNNVVYGIKENVIRDICDKKIFFIECVVAEGTEPVFGEAGYFKIPFSFDFDRKPKILPDGSVDYNQFDDFCRVSEGDVIAEYVHATKGSNGMDVLGKKLSGKNGKEQVPLKGKGFKLDENNNDIYIATTDGRLEYEENRSINVSNLYEVKGDVNHATGDIDFPGDVHIYGNVTAGATIKATGQIIVDGSVESANLYSDQDIILKNGMQGAGKGEIIAKGNVSAKFFEQTVVKADGKILAGAIMNCETESKESVIVSGKIGALIGGRTVATELIEANFVGNMSETKTFLKVGGGAALMAEIVEMNAKLEESKSTIDKLTEGIEKVEEFLKKNPNKDMADKKMNMIKLKFVETGKLDKIQQQKKELLEILAKSEKARVCVNKSIYSRVSININDIVLINKSENYNVTYTKRAGRIEFTPNP